MKYIIEKIKFIFLFIKIFKFNFRYNQTLKLFLPFPKFLYLRKKKSRELRPFILVDIIYGKDKGRHEN